jgi:hypothetical protein
MAIRICLSVVALFALLSCSQNEAEKQGPNWQFFIDDYWIATSDNIKKALHQPEKFSGNPLIKGDVPWEENPYCFGSVIYDNEEAIFKLWYQSYNYNQNVPERTPILYAISEDGFFWERPNLGIVEFQGSNNNNIVLQNYGYHDLYSPSVLKDDLEPNPDKRYKMIWWDFPLGKTGYQDDGMCVAHSPDGIHWNKYSHNPVLHANKSEQSISDVMSVFQDKRTGRYVAYTKGWAGPWPAFRQIVRTDSRDFLNWSGPQVVITHEHNLKDPQSYGMSVSQMGPVYLGLLHSYKNPGNETIDVQLAISHDNQIWDRVANQQTFIPLGNAGSWDDGMIFCAPMINHENKTLIYYGGWNGPHNSKTERKSGIGLATLRKNGFVSLNAGSDGGTLTIQTMRNVSGQLLVNANASNGSICAELLDSSGKPISGYALDECVPVMTNNVSQVIRWKNKTKLPKSNNPVSLRLKITNASLYCFSVGRDAVRLKQ